MTRFSVKNLLLLLMGAAAAAMGMALFLVPSRLSSGGIGSLGTVLYHLFGIPLSLTTVALNGLLLAWGFFLLGGKSTLLTVLGILFYSVCLELFSLLPPFEGEAIIASVCGGALGGLGVGLTLRAGGSTGGSDLAGLMLKKKFPHIATATLILLQDIGVIALAAAVFRSIPVAFFSSVAMLVSAKVGGAVLETGDEAKVLFIISRKSEELRKILLRDFRRGVTLVPCRGGWEQKSGEMLLSAVSPKEEPGVLRAVREIDPACFVICFDAREVLGEGFRPRTG